MIHQEGQYDMKIQVPVIIMKKAPIPNIGEQIIFITKESSLVSFKYSEIFCSNHIIIAIKNPDFPDKNEYNEQEKNFDQFEYSGILCKILDKIFDEKDYDSIEHSQKQKYSYKLKLLIQPKTRIRLNELGQKFFIYKNQNLFFPDKKFSKENLIFKKNLLSDQISENYFYIGEISNQNIENYQYIFENILLKLDSGTTNNPSFESINNYLFNLNSRGINFENIFSGKLSESKISEMNDLFKNYCNLYNLKINYKNIISINDHIKKIDSIVSKFDLNQRELFEFFANFDPNLRIDFTIKIIKKEFLRNQIDENIEEAVKKNLEKTQKIYLLNEKGKEISKQLDELNGEISDFDSMEEKLSKLKLSESTIKKIKGEIRRLKIMNQNSSDAGVIRNYLDWFFSLPFGVLEKLNMNFLNVSKILNEEHYGMEKVKERILQYLAVEFRGGITPKPALLLIGPPGVGKTSLSRKIASALGRKFVRISLGGVKDEADIRGHRRTYLGSMPGKIIQAIRDSGSMNPLILLDEIDKIAHDFRGDPASALLEVLDREQNSEFFDHYIDIPFDLSKVLFICTANNFDGISRPLYDRMEVIWLSSYSDDEKIQIAKNYMIPEQKKAHNFKENEIIFDDNVISKIIREYTYEAGVRGLEEQISIILRKSLLKILNENPSLPIEIKESNIENFLGSAKFIKYEDITESKGFYGIANGLAWNEAGGSVLTIECVSISLKDNPPLTDKKENEDSQLNSKTKTKKINSQDGLGGSVKFTGKLGDVMQESIQIAFSYIKANRDFFSLPASSYNNSEIHIHVPEGATPKDGPSAGITIFSALLSLFLKKPLNPSIAMTGEITLTGRILPIGGLKEKILAAKKHGIKTVIIPGKNKRDLEELPEILRQDIKIYLVDDAKEAINILFS